MITVQEDETEGESLIKEEYEDDPTIQLEENPQLSIHALESTYNYQTMRVKGSVGRKSLCILIDSGSTHNFIDMRVTTKLGCVLEPIDELNVIAANGNELRCREVCKAFSGRCKVIFSKLMC